MKKKRIAIIQPYIGKLYRGNETFFVQITKYLSKYYDIDVYSTGVDGAIKDNIIRVDYKMNFFLEAYLNLYDKSLWMKKLLNSSRYFIFAQPLAFYCRGFARKVYREYLKKEKYDLLFPGIGTAGTRQAIKYRKRHGVPVIYKGGGGIGPGEWWVLKLHPNCYICISSKHYEWAQQYWKKVCYIPNGTYIEKFQNEIVDEKFYINKGHKLVVCVGHLDTDFKRHQLAIEAVSKIDKVDLLILGQGGAEDELRQLAQKEMPGRCIIKGVKPDEMPYYYTSADLFTLPSLDEPFGIVYIEAMAAGLPVVATDDEVRREIIGDAGVLCNVEEAEEYANAIKKALITEWGDKPKERASKYDYSVVGEQYHQLIEDLINEFPYHMKMRNR